MPPLIWRELPFRLDAQRVIEPSFREVQLNVAILQKDAIAFIDRGKGRVALIFNHSRQDGAVLAGARLDPGGEREFVEVTEFAHIATIDEAPAVEVLRLVETLLQ